MQTKKIILCMCLPLLLLMCSCIQERESVIRQKLDVILNDDLASIIEDIDSSALLEKPGFELVEYKEYKEGSFSRMAVADFYFLRSVNKKITRKYRYIASMGMWDRYYNQYNTVMPETNETEN